MSVVLPKRDLKRGRKRKRRYLYGFETQWGRRYRSSSKRDENGSLQLDEAAGRDSIFTQGSTSSIDLNQVTEDDWRKFQKETMKGTVDSFVIFPPIPENSDSEDDVDEKELTDPQGEDDSKNYDFADTRSCDKDEFEYCCSRNGLDSDSRKEDGEVPIEEKVSDKHPICISLLDDSSDPEVEQQEIKYQHVFSKCDGCLPPGNDIPSSTLTGNTQEGFLANSLSSFSQRDSEEESQMAIPPPEEKRLKKTDFDTEEKTTDKAGSGIVSTSITPFQKFLLLLTPGKPNYEAWERLYRCVEVNKLDPQFLKSYDFPTLDNPALLCLVYPPTWDVIQLERPWGIELDQKEPFPLVIPTLSVDMLTKFLSLVHLNTVAGFHSQALAYSSSHGDIVKYFGVLPSNRKLSLLPFDEQDDYEELMFNAFIKTDSSFSRFGAFKSHCLIITHPTSSVFLSESDIVDLYKETCRIRNSFCIVLSPRSEGMKILCVQLTDEGFNEIKRLEEQTGSCLVYCKEYTAFMLEKKLSQSDFIFYRQISCRLLSCPCFYHDFHEKDETQDEIRRFYSFKHLSLW